MSNTGNATATRLATVQQTIKEMDKEQSYPPTVRELARVLGRTVSGVHKDLYTLRDLGRVEWDERKPRTLRIVRRRRP